MRECGDTQKHEQNTVQNVVNDVPKLLVQMIVVVYLALALDTVAAECVKHTAYHAGQDAGKTAVLTQNVDRCDIDQTDQDLLHRLLRALKQFKSQERNAQAHGKCAQNFLTQKDDKVFLLSRSDHALYENEQHNAGTVVEQAFALDDAGHALRQAQFI